MKHNFTKLNLLRNKPLYFMGEDEIKVMFSVPTFEDYLDNEPMMGFFSLLQVSLDQNQDYVFDNYLDLLIYCLKEQMFVEEIVTSMHLLIKEVKIEFKGIKAGEHLITKNEFEWLRQRWLIALGVESFEEEEKPEEDKVLSEMDRKMKAAEEKLKRIKNKRKEQQEGGSLEFDKIVGAIMKEFRISLPELLQMNMFSVFWYYQLCLRYNNYRVETIAYGNGLIKKHKYFIE